MERGHETPVAAIEFEHDEAADSQHQPELVGSSSTHWRGIGAAFLLIAALLGGLVVMNSRAADDAAQDGAAQDGVEPSVQEPTQAGTPASDPVSISVEMLPILLDDIETLDGELVGLRTERGPQPSLLISENGQEWLEIETTVQVEGESNRIGFEWFDLERVGNEVGLEAFSPTSGVVLFGSANAQDWDVVDYGDAAFPLRPLQFATSTESTLLVLQFFDEGTITCPDRTKPTELGGHFRFVSIDRTTGASQIVGEESFVVPFNYMQGIAPALENGRIGDLYFNSSGEAGIPCWSGEQSQPQGDVVAEFLLVDAVTGSAQTWTVPVAFSSSDQPDFLGEFVSGSLRRMLFAWSGELWTFQPEQEEWMPIWLPPSDDSSETPLYALSESGSRLYGLGDGTLHIWDFVDSGGILDVVSTVVDLEQGVGSPLRNIFNQVLYADDDTVVFNADGESWWFELPIELGSCERQVEAFGRDVNAIQIRCSMR